MDTTPTHDPETGELLEQAAEALEQVDLPGGDDETEATGELDAEPADTGERLDDPSGETADRDHDA